MTTLFCPTAYNAQFATLHYTDDQFKWQLTFWRVGKVDGHRWYETAIEAALQAAQLGLIVAGDTMSRLFEEDVILAGKE